MLPAIPALSTPAMATMPALPKDQTLITASASATLPGLGTATAPGTAQNTAKAG